MALVLKDRVKETSTTTGTGTLTLLGAATGFQSFSVIGNGNTTYYTIDGGSEWEVGIGTYTSSGTTLSRDTILESSNGGTAVNFSAGTKNVFVTYPAEKGLYTDASNNAIALGTPASATLTNATGLPLTTGVTGTLPIANGGTGTTSTTFTNLTTNVTGTLPIANGGTGTTSTTFTNLTTNVTGTLPVANGGTGTATTFTAGSVVFAGTSGVYSQSNANFFWDNTNSRLGIGTTSPDALLTVNTIASFGDGAAGTPSIAHKGDLNTGLWFPAADNIAASTSGSERWRIDSGGNLSSRTAFVSGDFAITLGVSGAYPVDRGISVANSSGSAIPFIAYTSSTTQAGYILTSGSTISFVQGSDYRLKEDIIDMDKAATLSKLMQVKPVNFDWKDGTKINQDGFIAHELQEIFPQVIYGEKDAVNADGSINPQGINLAQLIPYLVASIQEQQNIITKLQEQVLELQTKVGS